MNHYAKPLYFVPLVLFISLIFPSLSHAKGTVWEDLHVFTVKQCPTLADTMTIEDFDIFASKIYTPISNIPSAPQNIAPNFNQETGQWLCTIKRHQSEQNYLTMIWAQLAGVKPLALPLFQFSPIILTAAQCIAPTPEDKLQKENCPSDADIARVNPILFIVPSQRFQPLEEPSSDLENIQLSFYQAKQSLEEATLLLLKEAQLNKANAPIEQLHSVQEKLFKLLAEMASLQNQIDKALDRYKHTLDTHQ